MNYEQFPDLKNAKPEKLRKLIRASCRKCVDLVILKYYTSINGSPRRGFARATNISKVQFGLNTTLHFFLKKGALNTYTVRIENCKYFRVGWWVKIVCHTDHGACQMNVAVYVNGDRWRIE